MKKLTKVLTIVVLVAIIAMTASNVFAAGNIINDIEASANTPVNMGSLTKTVGVIIAYIRNAAIILGVIIIIILGIKYMTGSVEEKAGYQKSFVPLIIGIVIVMAATSIASFLFGIFG